MRKSENFLPASTHFNYLVSSLEPADEELFNSCRHTRVETGYRNRTFLLYRIEDRRPKILDELTILDFVCNEDDGASTEIRSRSGDVLVVGYTPTKVFDYPLFVYLPLHMQVRWDVKQSSPDRGSLGFPLVIKTMSRLHLRERGVVYMETGVSYVQEFGQPVMA